MAKIRASLIQFCIFNHILNQKTVDDNKELQEYIMRRIQEMDITDPSLEDFDKFISEWNNIHNNRSYASFQFYSPLEMRPLTYNIFEEGSPIQLTDLSDIDYTAIPLLQQAKVLMELIEHSNELKLTPKGNLPVSAVKRVYETGLPEYAIESGITKLTSEDNSISVQLVKMALQKARLIKVRNNKLSLTKSGKAIINNDPKLLVELLKPLLTELNLAYFDACDSENTGVIGIGFTLVLLDMYGDTKQNETFYASRYFDAYPNLIYEFIDGNPTNCYSLRTFDRLLHLLGLITIEASGVPGVLDRKKIIGRTDLFKKLFKITPPKFKYSQGQTGNEILN